MTGPLFSLRRASRLALAALLLGLAGTACAPGAAPSAPTPILAPSAPPAAATPPAPPPTAVPLAPTSPPTPAAAAIATATAAPRGAATPVRVVLNEWTVVPSVASVPAGEVTLDVANAGKLGHELIVVRTDRAPAQLALEADGARVEEAGPDQNDVGEVEDIGPGETKRGSLALGPGHYLFVCNIPGHYKAGMVAAFEVAPAAGQASSSAAQATPAPVVAAQATTVQVSMGEWSVNPSMASVPHGEVTFTVANQGKLAHELIVLKTDAAPDALALEADGARVEETAPGQDDVGEVEDIAAGTTKSGSMNLAPGRYVLVCNVPGHYKAGMVAAFEVK